MSTPSDPNGSGLYVRRFAEDIETPCSGDQCDGDRCTRRRPQPKPRGVASREALEDEVHHLICRLREEERMVESLSWELDRQSGRLAFAGWIQLIVVFGIGMVLGATVLQQIFFE